MDSKVIRIVTILEVLFVIDDIIANKDLDKTRQPLLELSILRRHRGRYLWLLTQSYKGIPRKLREQVKAIFVKIIHDGNDVFTDDKLVVARNFSKKSKHACLYIRNEFPRGFKLLNHA